MKIKVRCALLAGMKDTARSLEQGPLDMCFNEDGINLVATSGKHVSLARSFQDPARVRGNMSPTARLDASGQVYTFANELIHTPLVLELAQMPNGGCLDDQVLRFVYLS